ncbi:hypothetical protein C1752_02062 [Acaryochloris thomasi RCC1774]|uniref:Antitoxin n=1 Tax=Acaryochloris thomasi RCC1774 TaxID=1764569 RepID=A0A2W1JV83_9CYAN|nr:type II toxin-antitoxin system prevent-host-death family antitoxin [Acaryochloris thomasi]PZD73664.1 hypothetical protein C1752_02062 [Acaryochloris thomasi RCC1774]
MNQYSIAQARDQLAKIIHDAEDGTPIEITRRGKRVAMLLSADQYDRISTGQSNFWDSLVEFREELEREQLDLDPDEVFKDIRDQSPGREVEL